MIAEVIVDIDTQALDQVYDYKVSKEDELNLKVGMRVLVNFNARNVIAFVMSLKEDSTYDKLKTITKVIDIIPILNQEQLDLVKFIKINYYTSYQKAINLVLGNINKINVKQYLRVLDKENLSLNLKEILKRESNLYKKEYDKYKKDIVEAINKGIIKLEITTNINKLKEEISYIYLNDENLKSKKSKELLNYIKNSNKAVTKEEILALGYKVDNIKYLESRNLIKVIKKDIFNDIDTIKLNNIELTPTIEQKEAINRVKLNHYKTYLLHGITGSGKTLVYINLIKEVLKKDKEVIVLVPEISLTPQLAAVFKNAFKDDVAIFHSKLTKNERLSEYLKIKNKLVKIVLGPRSAIFMPFTNLGLIIVDEEQEDSYVSENSPSYDARVIALKRAEFYNIPLILGTATPRVISYFKALNKEYELLSLTKRPTKQTLPKVSLVDMREELKNKNISTISYKLEDEIRKTLEKKEQVILFYNKRGYASSVMCRDCGYIIKCPHCDMSLTYHKNRQSLVCHLCGYQMRNVVICPKCHSKRIRYVGLGTEKIVGDVVRLFKDARIYRVDSDSIGSDYNLFYDKIKNKEVDIVIGTQLIAKGLDFNDVTLVGVINADLGFFYPRYDANENNFALLEQVSGRAGRHKEGQVIIQTYNTNNFVLNAVINHDYKMFYDEEIKQRRLLDNPPFKKILKIILSDSNINLVKSEALKLACKLEKASFNIIGPSEAVYFKVNNVYYYEIYLKYVKINLELLTSILNTSQVYLKIMYL